MADRAEEPELAVGDGGPVHSESCHRPPMGSAVAFGSLQDSRALTQLQEAGEYPLRRGMRYRDRSRNPGSLSFEVGRPEPSIRGGHGR
jgi:hypothetical protein